MPGLQLNLVGWTGLAGSISPLAPLAYPLAEAAAGLRQLSGARAIGKVVTTAPPTPGRPAEEAGPGRWIITGGLGALGVISARWAQTESVSHESAYES
jgi:myxalamid-type polyketide synthase MxaB